MSQTAESGVTTINGRAYRMDSRGALVPETKVRPGDLLMDQTVRDLVAAADSLSETMRAFRSRAFDDVDALVATLAEQYGATIGGKKGNITLTSFDGCLQVRVQVQERVTFGPELQAAKSLVDECIESWSAGANDNIRALVEHAFQVDKEGRINRAALLQLRRVHIEDERWARAMAAIGESERVVGSAAYVRFYRRAAPDAPWEAVSLDLATV